MHIENKLGWTEVSQIAFLCHTHAVCVLYNGCIYVAYDYRGDACLCYQLHAVSQVHSAECHQQGTAAVAWKDN